jgi:carbonic anhydrase
MITQAKSGEMFVFRNVGNIAVDCGEMAGEVSAAIDYAMAALHACYLVICDHSDQGAQKCRLNPGGTCELETVNVWLGNAHARCNAVLARNLPDAKTSRVVTGDSLCPQLTHLRTHPSVAVALARISITLDGVGIYDVGDDKVEGREKVKIQYISICERIKDECAV